MGQNRINMTGIMNPLLSEEVRRFFILSDIWLSKESLKASDELIFDFFGLREDIDRYITWIDDQLRVTFNLEGCCKIEPEQINNNLRTIKYIYMIDEDTYNRFYALYKIYKK